MKTPAFFKQGFLCLFFAVLLFPFLVQAQLQPIEDFSLFAYVGVRVDKGPTKMVADMVQIQVHYPGYYRLYPRMAHDSGDHQLNESYFLTVHHSDGTVSTPEDPNAGPYRVVADSVGMDTVSVFENAGLFYFKQGTSTIRLHHYGEIYKQYPQFLHPPMGGTTEEGGAESVYIDSVLTVIAEPRIDGAVQVNVQTARIRLYNGELRQVAYPGEQVTITLRAQNINENRLRYAVLKGALPVALQNRVFSITPKAMVGDTLLWDVPDLEPQNTFTVTITGRLAATMPDGYTLLECPAMLDAPNDINLVNNTAIGQFWSLTDNGGPHQEKADLALRIESVTDSVDISAEGSLNIARENEDIQYTLRITNVSPDTAKIVKISSKLSPLVNYKNAVVTPNWHNADSLVWNFPLFLPYEVKVIPFTATVKVKLPLAENLVITKGYVTAVNDTLALNNTDVDTVKAIAAKPAADLALTMQAQTGKTTTINNTTVKAIYPGENYPVTLQVINNGPETAANAVLWSLKPDSVTLSGFTTPPTRQNGDTLFWQFGVLAPLDNRQVQFNAYVSSQVTAYPFEIQHFAVVAHPLDDNPANNSATDLVYVIEKILPPAKTDVAVTLAAITDTTVIIDNRERNAVKPGADYQYRVSLHNQGIHPAQTLRIVQKLPAYVQFNSTTLQPFQWQGDSLVWNLAELAAGNNATWLVNVTLANTVPDGIDWLTATVTETAVNDSTNYNNSDADTVKIVRNPVGPGKKMTDLALQMVSLTDTTVIDDDRTWNAVKPGGNYHYTITIDNNGPNAADTITVAQKLPANVSYKSAAITPYRQQGDSLYWNIHNLAASRDTAWTVEVTLSGNVPEAITWLTSTALMTASNDSTTTNNADADTVKIVRKPVGPAKKMTDLALQMVSLTDTTVTDGGRTWNAVKPGGNYQYRLDISNNGPNPADTIEIIQQLPANVTFKSAAITPYRQQGDSLFWRIRNLVAKRDTTWTVNVFLSNNVPAAINWLTGSALLYADNDSTLNNNSDADTVKIVRKPVGPGVKMTDLALQMSSLTDTTVIDDEQEWKAVKPGSEYRYTITINNNGPNSADTIEVIQKLPAHVSFTSAVITPYLQLGDSLFWRIRNLPSGQDTTWSVNVALSGSVSATVDRLISKTLMYAANDSTDNNNSAADTVRVAHKPVGPVDKHRFDAYVTLEALTDTTLELSEAVYKAVVAGNSFQYRLQVINSGAKPGGSISLRSVIPGILELSDFSITPVADNDTLFWSIDTLAGATTWTALFTATAPQTAPEFPYPVNATAHISAPRDTVAGNNNASALIYILQKQGAGELVDVVPQQLALPDSFAVSGVDTLKFAREGELYPHYIIAKNIGQVAAINVQITSNFPDSVIISNFNVPPAETTTGAATWRLDSLQPNAQVVFAFDVQVAAWMPVGTNMLINRVTISATNENTPQQNNNLSLNTVFNYVPEPPPFTPEIQVNPAVIDVTDSAQVRIRIPVQVTEWDLWVRLPNGQVDSTFADLFIDQNPSPTPDVWLDITDWYNQTKLVGATNEDLVIIELHAVNRRGARGTAQTQLLVRSGDHMVLDRNVYKPELEDYVNIRFKLGYQRLARLDVYDVSGRHITKLTEDVFNGGWNSWLWDGMLENGVQVGSGVYLITLQSGEFKDWKKLIIVR
ncbi:MAG TPA: hypothetical protein PLP19_04025 [bacterium]|nr:hypothetical protein [bacterium]HPN42636.1 hypothetical protein [bacterium]